MEIRVAKKFRNIGRVRNFFAFVVGLWLMTRDLKYMLTVCAIGFGGGLLLWDSLQKKDGGVRENYG